MLQPYHYNKLRGRIVEKYGTQKAFAEVVGISKNSLSMKMAGKTQFSQKDMDLWANLLDISKDEYHSYFFA